MDLLRLCLLPSTRNPVVLYENGSSVYIVFFTYSCTVTNIMVLGIIPNFFFHFILLLLRLLALPNFSPSSTNKSVGFLPFGPDPPNQPVLYALSVRSSKVSSSARSDRPRPILFALPNAGFPFQTSLTSSPMFPMLNN